VEEVGKSNARGKRKLFRGARKGGGLFEILDSVSLQLGFGRVGERSKEVIVLNKKSQELKNRDISCLGFSAAKKRTLFQGQVG